MSDELNNYPVLVYKHFTTTTECAKFMNYLVSNNIKIHHLCCSGKGVAIDKPFTEMELFYNNYINEHSVKDTNQDTTIMIQQ
jgi:hypothetical protein